MLRFPLIAAMRHYAGRARAIRNHIRTERLLNGLSPQLRADIGWPDRYPDGQAHPIDDIFRLDNQ